jgi:hypothetical protein
MTIYNDIIIAAHGYSTKSRPDEIATRATELLSLVYRAARGVFAAASRVNPEYWGTVANVANIGDAWARPENAQTVFGIERASDDAEVAIVPFDDRGAELSKPAVYLLGRGYRRAFSTLGPLDSDILKIYYSRIPVAPDQLTDVIDPEWESVFDNFLAIETAMYLALKDGRMDEYAALQPERAKEAQLFVEFLSNATPITSYRYGQPRRVAVPSILPLLAGGTP